MGCDVRGGARMNQRRMMNMRPTDTDHIRGDNRVIRQVARRILDDFHVGSLDARPGCAGRRHGKADSRCPPHLPSTGIRSGDEQGFLGSTLEGDGNVGPCWHANACSFLAHWECEGEYFVNGAMFSVSSSENRPNERKR
jgi:hypothetical protein